MVECTDLAESGMPTGICMKVNFWMVGGRATVSCRTRTAIGMRGSSSGICSTERDATLGHHLWRMELGSQGADMKVPLSRAVARGRGLTLTERGNSMRGHSKTISLGERDAAI